MEDQLMEAFIRRMVEALTPEELIQVRERNRKRAYPNVCHTHDFLDANEIMADAFEEVVGRKPDAGQECDASLWNDAWQLADKREFHPVSHCADSWKAWDSAGWSAHIEAKLMELGFEDSTWHNNVSPSFSHYGAKVRLWIYEAYGADREHEGECRFWLVGEDEDGQHTGDLCHAEEFEWILPAIEKAVNDARATTI